MLRRFLRWFFTDRCEKCEKLESKGAVCNNCGQEGLILQEVPVHHWGPDITTWGLFDANGEKHKCPGPEKPKGVVCRKCGQGGFVWKEVPSLFAEHQYVWKLYKPDGEIHKCPVTPKLDDRVEDDFLEQLKKL